MMSLTRSAWKEATWLFILSRMIIVAVTYVGLSTFPTMGKAVHRICQIEPLACVLSWQQWDAHGYLHLAKVGYEDVRNTVFFPLFPMAIRGVATVFGGSDMAYYIAGMLLANLFFYLALVLLYRLVFEQYDGSLARRSLFYLTFAPYALFFFAIYTESLFLLLSLGVFYFLHKGTIGSLWLAGVCGMLATLTRGTGFVVLVPMVVVFLQRFWPQRLEWRQLWMKIVQSALPMTLVPIGLALYLMYLGITKGDPLAFSTQEGVSWGRHLSLPWNGMIGTVPLIFGHSTLAILNLLDFVFTLIPLMVLIVGWRRIPLHYSLYALVMMIFALSYPFTPQEPLSAVPRYMVVIFPVTIIVAQWGKEERWDRVFVVSMLPMFAINVIRFITHQWVA